MILNCMRIWWGKCLRANCQTQKAGLSGWSCRTIGVGCYHFVYTLNVTAIRCPTKFDSLCSCDLRYSLLFLSPCHSIIANYHKRTSSGAYSFCSVQSRDSANESQFGREPSYRLSHKGPSSQCREQWNKCSVLHISQEISPILWISIGLSMCPKWTCKGLHACCLDV